MSPHFTNVNSSSGPWQLEGRIARLSVGRLTAQVDVLQPHLGLHEVRYAGAATTDCRLLLSEIVESEADAPSDFYVRGNDLVVTYPQTRRRLGTCQYYWRVVDLDGGPSFNGAVVIELQVSAHTSLLESQAGIQVDSRIDGEVLSRTNGEANFAKQTPSVEFTEIHEPALFLVRPERASWSYVEAVHPEDFCIDALELSPTDSRRRRLSHMLLVGPLEKGVIVRSRVRGALVPRNGDEAAAAAVYEHFLGSPLPLTT